MSSDSRTGAGPENPGVIPRAYMAIKKQICSAIKSLLNRLSICSIGNCCYQNRKMFKKILMDLEEQAPTRAALLLPDSRAPPQASLFG